LRGKGFLPKDRWFLIKEIVAIARLCPAGLEKKSSLSEAIPPHLKSRPLRDF